MKFHKEGIPSLIITIIVVAIINFLTCYFFCAYPIILWLGYLLSAFLLITILQFFRSPNRGIIINDNHIIAPADGKVVVIEEVTETQSLTGTGSMLFVASLGVVSLGLVLLLLGYHVQGRRFKESDVVTA